MNSELLQTKYQIPFPQPQVITRVALNQRLDQAVELGHRLILVSAPTGYGKTTLINSWVNQIHEKCPVAWLSLDPDDNSPERFFQYFLKALQVDNPQIGSEQLKYLQTNKELPLAIALQNVRLNKQLQEQELEEHILIPLLNELTTLPKKLIIILDDFQQIVDPIICCGIAYLIKHLPSQVAVVLITRADPPLPISELRAHGLLTEIRTPDMSLSAKEVTEILKKHIDYELPKGDMEKLATCTEGWAAGLQMAVAAIQALLSQASVLPQDEIESRISKVIDSLSGKHSYFFDFLYQEVFQLQPLPIQDFLIKSSILERLSAPLCDYVVEPQPLKDSPSESISMEILNYLEKSNLFLFPLDSERGLYRYHQLFKELLVNQLAKNHPEWEKDLHIRASGWYEANQEIDLAIIHRLSGKDWNGAGKLLEQYSTMLLRRGELQRLIKWFNSLPETIILENPKLCLRKAWVLCFANKFSGIEDLLHNIEQKIASDRNKETPELEEAEINRMLADVTFIRSFSAMVDGNRVKALAIAQEGINAAADYCVVEKSYLYWIAGFASSILSDFTTAIDYLSEASRLAKKVNDFWIVMISLTDLASIYLSQGNYLKAEATFSEALQVASENGMADHGYISRIDAGLADICREKNQLDQALDFALSGVKKAGYWNNSNHIVWGQMQLARVLKSAGRFGEARKNLELAEKVIQTNPVLPGIKYSVEVTRIQLCLASNDFSSVRQWARDIAKDLAENPGKLDGRVEAEEGRILTYVRVLIAENGPDENWLTKGTAADLERRVDSLREARELLKKLTTAAEVQGQIRFELETYLLQGLTCFHLSRLAAGEREKAENLQTAIGFIENSLSIAEEGGFLRIYLEEGVSMKNLLSAVYRQVTILSQKSYLAKLLLEFNKEPGGQKDTDKRRASLVEPLTPREIEILEQMAKGLSTNEIAREFVLSTGTVKAHMARIYQKLDVHNRLQALAVAKSLHLLNQ